MVDPKLEQEIHLLHKRVCYALGDPSRLLILYALADGPMCVNELVRALRMSQSTASRHLAVLRERGLAGPERRGTAIYYHLTDRRVIQALDLLRALLAAQIQADSNLAQTLA